MFTPLVIKAHYKICKKINKDKPDNRPDSNITVNCYKCKQNISITNIKKHSAECKAKNTKQGKGRERKRTRRMIPHPQRQRAETPLTTTTTTTRSSGQS